MKRFILSLVVVLALAVGVALAVSPASALYTAKCASCHGADGSKIASASGKDALKGQSAEEITAKLKGYADGSFGGTKKTIMEKIAKKLSDEDVAALSAHISTL